MGCLSRHSKLAKQIALSFSNVHGLVNFNFNVTICICMLVLLVLPKHFMLCFANWFIYLYIYPLLLFFMVMVSNHHGGKQLEKCKPEGYDVEMLKHVKINKNVQCSCCLLNLLKKQKIANFLTVNK